ncbi:MAG: di-trans,poly-cis-decaprenylcistransferase [Syntrophobacterales bacterium]|jgi:short-chain Z-isoprenyl diphosphate synthase|nr:di-trans,poly-cis-decaprenylcistransferase [Syntrophobacterales bacterium]
MPVKRLLYYSYAKILEREVRKGVLPTHIGLILDGNRRYAVEMGFDDPTMGYMEGARKLDDVLKWCADLDIKIITIWVYSTDNTQRDKGEIEGLLKVVERKLDELSRNPLVKLNGVRIRVLGNLNLLSEELRDVIRRCEEQTKDHEHRILNIAVGYGGREEIVEAVRQAIRGKNGMPHESLAEHITMDDITSHLYTCGIPDPDLIIRTSGEIRLSGFLLWQSAYSEFYFCDALWPVFRKIDFLRAIRSYQQRSRRFGK